MKIGVYIAGHNCAEAAGKCIASLKAQTFTNWVACAVDDKSTDNTRQACLAAAGDDLTIEIRSNEQRSHSCWSKLRAINALRKHLAPNDILVGLDLDDALKPNALQVIHDAHAAGAWVTYGNWEDQNGKRGTEYRQMTPGLMEHVRDVPWFLTAPNTFRARVFDQIPVVFFQWGEGGYYQTGFDGSVMFAAADLADVDRITGIDEAIYIYNRERAANVMNAWPAEHRVALFAEQRRKPRLERIESLG